MKYPIDVEGYMAAMRQASGVNAARDEAHVAMIQVLNDAYADGLSGNDRWFPLDPNSEVEMFEDAIGRKTRFDGIVRASVAWINCACECGRREMEAQRNAN